MKILLVVSSKHGSTEEIAAFIADELHAQGHIVAQFDAEGAPPPAGYDAVMIGSAIYVGSWMSEALKYVDTYSEALKPLPVWLFSSGPLGEGSELPEEEPTQLQSLLEKTSAIEHVAFVGAVDKEKLNFMEKLAMRMIRAPYGDHRDWHEIREWVRTLELSTVRA